jgi:hypothetical protein
MLVRMRHVPELPLPEDERQEVPVEALGGNGKNGACFSALFFSLRRNHNPRVGGSSPSSAICILPCQLGTWHAKFLQHKGLRAAIAKGGWGWRWVILCRIVTTWAKLLVLPWTNSAARRERLQHLCDFEQLRELNLSQVVAMIGPPSSKKSPSKGFADVYMWRYSFGVPPFSNEYRLGATCGSDGEICAGGIAVNGESYRP